MGSESPRFHTYLDHLIAWLAHQAPNRTPMADHALCRQPPKVGAVCVNVNAHVRI